MTLKILFISTFCMLHPIKIFAQFSESFLYDQIDSSGWLGDLSDFTFTNGMLQVNKPEAESQNQSLLFIEAATSINDNTYWYFDWLMDFSPSSSNYALIWLSAEWESGVVGDGYFLRMGGYSGDMDKLTLNKQIEGQTFVLGQSEEGYMHDPESVFRRIEVHRSSEGHWEVFGSTQESGELDFLFEAWDDTLSSGTYFGFDCRYTKTRNEHFYCDSVFITPLYTDLSIPEIEYMEYVSEGRLKLTFNEGLNGGNLLLYLDNELLAIDYEIYENQLLINLGDLLSHGSMYELKLEALSDTNGNSGDFEFIDEFIFVALADRGDLLVSECFFEPNQVENPLGPDFEYIELYNSSAHALNLEDYSLEINGELHFFEKRLLMPYSYIVVSGDTTVVQLGENTLYHSSLSVLPNSGGAIKLYKVSGGRWLDQFSFHPGMYRNDERERGGYSLERINYESICLGEQNWRASEELSGCSPGRANSIRDDSWLVPLTFDLGTSSDQLNMLTLKSNYLLADSLSKDWFFTDADLSISMLSEWLDAFEYRLYFDMDMNKGQRYGLYCSSSLRDCLDESILWGEEASFGIGKDVIAGDIIINEIMNDPLTDCDDFVELYLPFDSILDSEHIFLEYKSGLKNYWYSIDLPSFQNADYYVLMKDTVDLEYCYSDLSFDRVVLVDNLRKMDKDSFSLALYIQYPNQGLELLDQVDYELGERGNLIDWQGKSYERLRAGLWKTALGPEFCSPGLKNQDLFLINKELNEPFKLYSSLLVGESSALIVLYDLKGGQGRLTTYMMSFGHSKIYKVNEDKYLNGEGILLLENLQLQILRNGFNMLFLALEREGGEVEYFRLPFYLMK